MVTLTLTLENQWLRLFQVQHSDLDFDSKNQGHFKVKFIKWKPIYFIPKIKTTGNFILRQIAEFGSIDL